MTRKKSASARLVLTAAAAALGLGTAAQAQEAYGAYPAPYAAPAHYPGDEGYDSYDRPYGFDDLTIVAPRRERLGRSPTTGAPIERVSLSRVVSVRDLDLNTSWGVDALYARINQAARAACRELDARHPIAVSGDPPCVRTALQDAYIQADDIISAARNP